jgi:hypothetical protein
MFCSQCGAKNPDTNKFCTACGKPLGSPAATQVATPAPQAAPTAPAAQVATVAAPPQGGEKILAIVPYVEQGTVFTDAYTLVITSARLIFTRVPENMADAYAAKEEEIDDEWVEFSDLARQRSHLATRDWNAGPWQPYAAMSPDAIAASSEKNQVFSLAQARGVIIIVDKEIGLEDTIIVAMEDDDFEFSMRLAAGDRIAPLLSSLLGQQRYAQYTKEEWRYLHKKHSFGPRYKAPF